MGNFPLMREKEKPTCNFSWGLGTLVIELLCMEVPPYIITRAVSHCGLPIYIKKYPNAEEEFWKFKYFTMQIYNLQKNPLKRNQNPSRYYITL